MPKIVKYEVELYPRILLTRLGEGAPEELFMLGNRELLQAHRTALFCSSLSPGSAILKTHDAAKHLRDEGRTVISGFHSPLEMECLQILLRGKQPIIICPARAIETLRIPKECRAAFDAGRLLFLSPFIMRPIRITRDTAFRRSLLIAALADEALLAHMEPGGQTELIHDMLREWGVPIM